MTLVTHPKAGFSGVNTLHAQLHASPDPKMRGTCFELTNINATEVQAAKSMFMKFSGEEVVATTKYGSVLRRTEGSRAAPIYIRGIKVAVEDKFAFGYNITDLTKDMLKMLNRERTNVGREAYRERVIDILLHASSTDVSAQLVADLECIHSNSDEGHEEVVWSKVNKYACVLREDASKSVEEREEASHQAARAAERKEVAAMGAAQKAEAKAKKEREAAEAAAAAACKVKDREARKAADAAAAVQAKKAADAKAVAANAAHAAALATAQKNEAIIDERKAPAKALPEPVFVTASDMQSKQHTIDQVARSKKNVVLVADATANALPSMKTKGGAAMPTIRVFNAAWAASHTTDFIPERKLNPSERAVFGTRKQLAELFGGMPDCVREVCVAERIVADGTEFAPEGLWQPRHGRIIIQRSLLRNVERFSGTLLHEMAHARSGYHDVSRDFESELTNIIGHLAAQLMAAKREERTA